MNKDTKHAGHARKRSRRNLVALGSSAVLAVYAAGYLRTSSAAHKLADMERKRPGTPDDLSTRETAQTPVVVQSTGSPLASTAVVVPPPASTETPAVAAVTPALVAVTQAPVAAAATPAPASAPVAPAPTVASNAMMVSTAAPAQANPAYKDGSFFGWGYCRHGDLKVLLVIKDGRIESAKIDECYTRYSQNVIAMLPGQVVARQSANVDRISRATQSSDAFYYAVVEALKVAKL